MHSIRKNIAEAKITAGNNTVTEVKHVKKKEKPRQFGDFRFDYLTCQKHDLKIDNVNHYSKVSKKAAEGTSKGNCPMCCLIAAETKIFFDNERINKEKARLEGQIRGINMRIKLLHLWTRNQCSTIENFPNCNPVVEIALSGSLVKAIEKLQCPPDSSKIANILSLRNRIAEVGHFAALFLQCRIRKYCCRLRIRRYMLRRFEFVPATRRIPDSYFDSALGKRIYNKPVLLKNERASSPRTVQRRLNSEDKKRKERYENYLKSLPSGLGSESTLDLPDIWEEYSNKISNMRQIELFRDGLLVALESLNNMVYGSTNNDNNENGDEKMPVLVSFSHPAPTTYEFGMNLALNTPSFNKLSDDHELIPESSEFFKIINERLRAFDEISYDSMKCEGVEDIVDKCFNEDLVPLYNSMERMASDPKLWDAELNNSNYSGVVTQKRCIQLSNTPEKSESDKTHQNHIISPPKFLPLFLRIHPFDTSIGVASMFRLFFLNGSLAAVTQVSVWSCHQELLEFKDSMIHAIASFSSSLNVKSLVTNIMRSHTPSKAGNSDNNNSSKLDLNYTGKKAVEKINLIKMYIPDEKMVYHETPNFKQKSLNYEDYMSLGGNYGEPAKYKFLSKLSSWNSLYTKAKKAGKPKSKPTPVAPPGYYVNEAGEIALIPRALTSDGKEVTMSKFPPSLCDKLQSLSINRSISSGPSKTDNDKMDQEFIEVFQELALNTDSDMKKRLRELPNHDADADADDDVNVNNTDCPKNLVVIEMSLDIPRTRVPKPSKIVEAKAKESKDTVSSSLINKKSNKASSGPPLRKNSVSSQPPAAYSAPSSSIRKFNGALHRVVGLYSTQEPCPSSLETGLFEWEDIAAMGKASSSLHESASSVLANAAEMTLTPDLIDSNTGVLTAERKLPNGKLFLFKLLAKPLNKLEFDRKIPKKIKSWIGYE